ncbi:hypothetical protein pb186bvf_012915 [Paramecium bursaria]
MWVEIYLGSWTIFMLGLLGVIKLRSRRYLAQISPKPVKALEMLKRQQSMRSTPQNQKSPLVRQLETKQDLDQFFKNEEQPKFFKAKLQRKTTVEVEETQLNSESRYTQRKLEKSKTQLRMPNKMKTTIISKEGMAIQTFKVEPRSKKKKKSQLQVIDDNQDIEAPEPLVTDPDIQQQIQDEIQETVVSNYPKQKCTILTRIIGSQKYSNLLKYAQIIAIYLRHIINPSLAGFMIYLEIQFYYIILTSLALVLILRILDKIIKKKKLLLAYSYCFLLFLIGFGGTITLFLILNYDTLALLYSCPSFAFDIIIIDPVRFIIYSNCLVKPVKQTKSNADILRVMNQIN